MWCQEISFRTDSVGFFFDLITHFTLKSMQLHGEILSQHWISEKDLKYIHRFIVWLPSFDINVGGYSEISVSIQNYIALSCYLKVFVILRSDLKM